MLNWFLARFLCGIQIRPVGWVLEGTTKSISFQFCQHERSIKSHSLVDKHGHIMKCLAWAHSHREVDVYSLGVGSGLPVLGTGTNFTDPSQGRS